MFPTTIRTRSAAFLASSFCMMLARWNSIVRGLTSSQRAASLLEAPRLRVLRGDQGSVCETAADLDSNMWNVAALFQIELQFGRGSSEHPPVVYPSICVSPQIEIACPEIVLPRGLHMNRI